MRWKTPGVVVAFIAGIIAMIWVFGVAFNDSGEKFSATSFRYYALTGFVAFGMGWWQPTRWFAAGMIFGAPVIGLFSLLAVALVFEGKNPFAALQVAAIAFATSLTGAWIARKARRGKT